MEAKFDVYAEYIDTCKGILHLLDFNDLSTDLQDIIDRWDQLSSNMDDLLCRVEMYKVCLLLPFVLLCCCCVCAVVFVLLCLWCAVLCVVYCAVLLLWCAVLCVMYCVVLCHGK